MVHYASRRSDRPGQERWRQQGNDNQQRDRQDHACGEDRAGLKQNQEADHTRARADDAQALELVSSQAVAQQQYHRDDQEG